VVRSLKLTKSCLEGRALMSAMEVEPDARQVGTSLMAGPTTSGPNRQRRNGPD
jgi:hypothetical protein